jgi:hypothetical protein
MSNQIDIYGTDVPAKEYPPGNSVLDDDEGHLTCTYCHEADEEVEEHETGNGETIVAHRDCFIDEYTWVPSCDAFFPSDETVWSEDEAEPLHVDEAWQCECCSEWYSNDSSTYYVHGGWSESAICECCANNGDYVYPEDDECNLYHIDSLYYSDRHDAWFTEPHNDGPLHCYSTDVLDVVDHIAYLGDGRTTYHFGRHLVFGIELETDSRGESPEYLADRLCDNTDFGEFGICKEDGSISGIELVTVPGTLSAHSTEYHWDQWCNELRGIARGHYGNAGMHVHVNRAAISALTLGKMLVFCNDTVNSEFLSMIAQRNILDSQWCGINPQKFDKVGKSAADPYAGKYSILNVTRHTVEVRMFNSSLIHERVLKNIEFCHALVAFCRDVSARNLRFGHLVQFINSNKDLYPNLSKFVSDRSEA